LIVTDRLMRALPMRRQVGGAALTLGGLAADGAIGLAILRGGAPWLLLVHLPAALIWAEGISLLEGRSLWRAFSRLAPPPAPPRSGEGSRKGAGVNPLPFREAGALWAEGGGLNGRTLVLALIGLLLFPGFGTVGCTVALVLSSLRVMAHHQRALPPTQIEAGLPTLARQRMSDPIRDLSIEPLVDILREPENVLRHAAVRLLGRRCDRESVALLRGLLADADPDIRGEASTTLFNFENQVNRALSDALGYARRAPESADAHAEVAAAYRQIVACDLLDAPSARLYLTRAAAALQEATALEPACARHWIALAHVQNDLDETAAASAAVARARSLDPNDREASLLTMELAFREQRWADLVALSAGAAGMDELLDWWAAGAPPPTPPRSGEGSRLNPLPFREGARGGFPREVREAGAA
jgi:hypothetical protein